MKVDIATVTPAMAREWLTTNSDNRPVRRSVVSRYAGDMARGEWQLNGEAIVLNGDRVLDGQHRLLACIEAGVNFDSVLVTDAPTEAMATLDQGVSRNFADVLRWRGLNDTNHLASAIRTLWMWDHGALLTNIGPSIQQMLEFFENNERIVSASKFSKRLTGAPLKLRGSVGAPVYFKALNADETGAAEFFDRLLDGEHISHGDPVYALRRALITNSTRIDRRLGRNMMMAFVIKAWNAWVMQEPMQQLHWKRTEKFPVMIDMHGNPISAEQ